MSSMNYEQVGERNFAIRVARGEAVVAALLAFCQQERIKGGFFTGIGAVGELELAHYSVEGKKYSTKQYSQPLEVTNMTGNVSVLDDELVVHTHGTFSDTEMHVVAGHIVEMTVSGTLEIFFTETSPLQKVADEETGLRLFDLGNTL